MYHTPHNPFFYLSSISPNVDARLYRSTPQYWVYGFIFLPIESTKLVNFHTLELVSCLRFTDVPFLIRWLTRLPNLVRLILKDDAIGEAATTLGQDTDDANLYKAPSSIADGWLCPSLMILHPLRPIARARGGIASPEFEIPPPSRLRRIEATLYSSSQLGERELATGFPWWITQNASVLYVA